MALWVETEQIRLVQPPNAMGFTMQDSNLAQYFLGLLLTSAIERSEASL